jgi:hypothetical protein
MGGSETYLQPLLVFLLLGATALSMGFVKVVSPIIHLANRWMRWILTALVMATLFVDPNIPIRENPQSFLTTFLLVFLVWLLLETVFNWVKISLFSKSTIPLFPRYAINHDGDEWPVDPTAIDTKDWLSKNGYTKSQSLKCELSEDFALRTSFYRDEEDHTRIQILFLPVPSSARSTFFSICTKMDDGSRYITDNVSMPFAIFTPENWHMQRKPLILSLQRLLQIHQARIAEAPAQPAGFEVEPYDDLEEQRRRLEKVNLDHGFLHPQEYHEEYGRLTSEGRYRMWKEMWLMSYLGRSLTMRP